MPTRFSPFTLALALSIALAPADLRASDASARCDAADAPRDAITLELIMSDPDWIGNAPEAPYWADDGASIFFSQKRPGEEGRDLIQIDPTGTILRLVSDEEKGTIDVSHGRHSSDWSRKIYTRGGNLFLKDIATGELTQLIRSAEQISDARFMVGDERIMFRRGGHIIIRDLTTGVEIQPLDLRTQDDPEERRRDSTPDYLTAQQERLFETILRTRERREEQRERQRAERLADSTRLQPWYLGSGIELRETNLSPAGDWALIRAASSQRQRSRQDTMPQFITEDSYVATRTVRAKVGAPAPPVGESLILLDVVSRRRFDLDLSVLPGITDDPFQLAPGESPGDSPSESEETADPPEINSDEAQEDRRDAPPRRRPREAASRARPVSIRSITWSDDGSQVAFQAHSADNKDRWIAVVDFDEGRLIPIHHLRDTAWIGRFNQMGWLPDNRTLYYLSEETGYSHLYLRSIDEDAPRALTYGDYEVSDLHLSRDGSHIYYTANAEHPGIHEAHRVNMHTGLIERLTFLRGRSDWWLLPDETQLLVRCSWATRPPELFVVPVAAGGAPTPDPPGLGSPRRFDAARLTHTVSDEFASLPWIEPQIVEVPSRHGFPIYSRLYLPPEDGSMGFQPVPSNSGVGVEAHAPHNKRPAVMFVHGAGYLQNAHHGWSRYFREFMFHSLLAHRGYVVLDMDFRASAGYGRDWRTAIYRRMGEPELEDLADGVEWLVAHHGVDRERIGIYGGSYGGFLTLMALFREPDLFACGAALRPVTDWAHYNHGYTSNILDTPDIAPEAYEASSPIEFAEGLKRPLLMCHGMLDDNVFVKDTIRLAQRLIELEKEDWEMALYPVEAHAFSEPSSWLDQYRRILKLFETNLRADEKVHRREGTITFP